MLDYSVGDRIPLDENALDENAGTCGAPAWDWNGNMTYETGVVLNLNPQDFEAVLCGSTLSVLQDNDDWAGISFAGLQEADGAGRRRAPEVIDCTNPPPADRPGN